MIVVNIGANNGQDQCLDFVLANIAKITEVHLIEPAGLEECRKAYESVPQAKFHQIAIVPDDSTSVTIYKPQDESLSAHASVSKEHVYQHGHPEVDSFEVEAMNLEKFFKSQGITKCDRLHIDTEGLDCQILLSLDIEKYGFEWIEFEVIHADGTMKKGDNYNAVVEKLKNLGYEIFPTSDYNEAARKI